MYVYFLQPPAAVKRVIFDAFHAAADGHARQRGASSERRISDAFHAAADGHACQRGAVFKRGISDRLDRIGDADGKDVRLAGKSVFCDGGQGRSVFGGGWDREPHVAGLCLHPRDGGAARLDAAELRVQVDGCRLCGGRAPFRPVGGVRVVFSVGGVPGQRKGECRRVGGVAYGNVFFQRRRFVQHRIVVVDGDLEQCVAIDAQAIDGLPVRRAALDQDVDVVPAGREPGDLRLDFGRLRAFFVGEGAPGRPVADREPPVQIEGLRRVAQRAVVGQRRRVGPDEGACRKDRVSVVGLLRGIFFAALSGAALFGV